MLKTPFDANDMDELYENVQGGRFTPFDGFYSAELRRSVKRLLSLDCKKRPSCPQILEFGIFEGCGRRQRMQNTKSIFGEGARFGAGRGWKKSLGKIRHNNVVRKHQQKYFRKKPRHCTNQLNFNNNKIQYFLKKQNLKIKRELDKQQRIGKRFKQSSFMLVQKKYLLPNLGAGPRKKPADPSHAKSRFSKRWKATRDEKSKKSRNKKNLENRPGRENKKNNFQIKKPKRKKYKMTLNCLPNKKAANQNSKRNSKIYLSFVDKNWKLKNLQKLILQKFNKKIQKTKIKQKQQKRNQSIENKINANFLYNYKRSQTIKFNKQELKRRILKNVEFLAKRRNNQNTKKKQIKIFRSLQKKY